MAENNIGENYADKLRRLKAEVRQIESMQARCNHNWGPTQYVPEKVEIMRYEQEKQGSDIYWTSEPTGRYEWKDKWSRTCTKCGKTEYTTEQYTSYQEVKGGPKFR